MTARFDLRCGARTALAVLAWGGARHRQRGLGRALLWACTLVGCGADVAHSAPAISPRDASGDAASPQPSELPSAEATRPEFCSRAGDDAVRDAFCRAEPPHIASLHDLQVLLRLTFLPDGTTETPYTGFQASTPASSDVELPVVLGHSTALSGHVVSPINPRVIVLGQHTLMAFQRGVQQVELAARARDRSGFDFYLLRFKQACNERASSCSPGDLYTPRLETDWTSTEIQDDEALKNTPSDCRQCHQRGLAEPTLLMRELQSPWTHFFEPRFATPPDITPPGVRGYDLLNEYVAAKGDELYGGTSVAGVAFVAPFVLQNRVGFTQPLLFDAPRIEDERWPYSAASGYATVPSPSPTWDAAYDAFKRGEQLALPYFDTRASDLDKQTQVSTAYQRYRAGEIAADELPDMADVFPDDPSVRARIGLQTEPDATPVEVLIQACGACHNDVLDQSISRARFNVAVARLERGELERAIERIQRLPSELGAMPPPDARQLDASAQARLLEYLRQDSRSADDDAKLEHAATLGMAGGARTIIDEHDD